jgi:acyl-CoA thioester hydrolase
VAKPESWRLDPASYPTHVEMQTRFQDMDINGHLNNVAFAVLFENARVLVNRTLRPWGIAPKMNAQWSRRLKSTICARAIIPTR